MKTRKMSTYSGLDLETLGSWLIMSKILHGHFPKGIENKNTVQYAYLTGIKNHEILIIDTQMVKRRWYQTNTGWHLIVAYLWTQSLVPSTKIRSKRCTPDIIFLGYLDLIIIAFALKPDGAT